MPTALSSLENNKRLYQLIGLNNFSSIEDVRSTYKMLALKYHPDKTCGDAELTEKFKEIKLIYELLSNEERKRRYDESLRFYLSYIHIDSSNETGKTPRNSLFASYTFQASAKQNSFTKGKTRSTFNGYKGNSKIRSYSSNNNSSNNNNHDNNSKLGRNNVNIYNNYNNRRQQSNISSTTNSYCNSSHNNNDIANKTNNNNNNTESNTLNGRQSMRESSAFTSSSSTNSSSSSSYTGNKNNNSNGDSTIMNKTNMNEPCDHNYQSHTKTKHKANNDDICNNNCNSNTVKHSNSEGNGNDNNKTRNIVRNDTNATDTQINETTKLRNSEVNGERERVRLAQERKYELLKEHWKEHQRACSANVRKDRRRTQSAANTLNSSQITGDGDAINTVTGSKRNGKRSENVQFTRASSSRCNNEKISVSEIDINNENNKRGNVQSRCNEATRASTASRVEMPKFEENKTDIIKANNRTVKEQVYNSNTVDDMSNGFKNDEEEEYNNNNLARTQLSRQPSTSRNGVRIPSLNLQRVKRALSTTRPSLNSSSETEHKDESNGQKHSVNNSKKNISINKERSSKMCASLTASSTTPRNSNFAFRNTFERQSCTPQTVIRIEREQDFLVNGDAESDNSMSQYSTSNNIINNENKYNIIKLRNGEHKDNNSNNNNINSKLHHDDCELECGFEAIEHEGTLNNGESKPVLLANEFDQNKFVDVNTEREHEITDKKKFCQETTKIVGIINNSEKDETALSDQRMETLTSSSTRSLRGNLQHKCERCLDGEKKENNDIIHINTVNTTTTTTTTTTVNNVRCRVSSKQSPASRTSSLSRVSRSGESVSGNSVVNMGLTQHRCSSSHNSANFSSRPHSAIQTPRPLTSRHSLESNACSTNYPNIIIAPRRHHTRPFIFKEVKLSSELPPETPVLTPETLLELLAKDEEMERVQLIEREEVLALNRIRRSCKEVMSDVHFGRPMRSLIDEEQTKRYLLLAEMRRALNVIWINQNECVDRERISAAEYSHRKHVMGLESSAQYFARKVESHSNVCKSVCNSYSTINKTTSHNNISKNNANTNINDKSISMVDVTQNCNSKKVNSVQNLKYNMNATEEGTLINDVQRDSNMDSQATPTPTTTATTTTSVLPPSSSSSSSSSLTVTNRTPRATTKIKDKALNERTALENDPSYVNSTHEYETLRGVMLTTTTTTRAKHEPVDIKAAITHMTKVEKEKLLSQFTINEREQREKELLHQFEEEHEELTLNNSNSNSNNNNNRKLPLCERSEESEENLLANICHNKRNKNTVVEQNVKNEEEIKMKEERADFDHEWNISENVTPRLSNNIMFTRTSRPLEQTRVNYNADTLRQATEERNSVDAETIQHCLMKLNTLEGETRHYIELDEEEGCIKLIRQKCNECHRQYMEEKNKAIEQAKHERVMQTKESDLNNNYIDKECNGICTDVMKEVNERTYLETVEIKLN